MRKILVVIVISQFFCTSIWFAGNAVLPDLVRTIEGSQSLLANMTSAVQFGFISGTLLFAVLAIADRFSPSLVFFISALIAALFNLALLLPDISIYSLLSFRFLTGFFLAGIYPVGMKIASDHFPEGLGKSLGFLVGALVLGTAFPHLLKTLTVHLPWKSVIYTTSALSVLGGSAIYSLVPPISSGKPLNRLNFNSFLKGFQNRRFNAAALGYFGHMWELYTFWTFVPLILEKNKMYWNKDNLPVSLFSFLIIAMGALACALSGLLSKRRGEKSIATIALALSGLCCLLSPLVILQKENLLLIPFLCIWGMAVVADSPMFSTLVARNAPQHSRGSSLTIVNCIGFAITIISIEFLNLLQPLIPGQYLFTLLGIGPLFGLIALLKNRNRAEKL